MAQAGQQASRSCCRVMRLRSIKPPQADSRASSDGTAAESLRWRLRRVSEGERAGGQGHACQAKLPQVRRRLLMGPSHRSAAGRSVEPQPPPPSPVGRGGRRLAGFRAGGVMAV